jgi:hypothetical protein
MTGRRKHEHQYPGKKVRLSCQLGTHSARGMFSMRPGNLGPSHCLPTMFAVAHDLVWKHCFGELGVFMGEESTSNLGPCERFLHPRACQLNDPQIDGLRERGEVLCDSRGRQEIHVWYVGVMASPLDPKASQFTINKISSNALRQSVRVYK